MADADSNVTSADVSFEELKEILHAEQARLINVLPHDSFRSDAIPGSINLPLAEIEATARSVIPNLAEPIVVHCAGPQCHAAHDAQVILARLGYTNVHHFRGGLEEWKARGEKTIAGSPSSFRALPGASARLDASREVSPSLLLHLVGETSATSLLLLYLLTGLVFAVFAWAASAFPGHGLASNGVPLPFERDSLPSAIYFSFVTALTIGYGDLTPLGIVRVLAVIEAAIGLLLFGALISKLVSARQEALTEEIHRLSFEDRLGRVRTNLYLVHSELDDIEDAVRGAAESTERLLHRVESITAILDSELATVHELLYRSADTLDERLLGSLLASLAACLERLATLLELSPQTMRESSLLQCSVGHLGLLAREICADCVPAGVSPTLASWLTRLQVLTSRFPNTSKP